MSFKLTDKWTGETLARDYEKGQWYWTTKDWEIHYFTTEKEAEKLLVRFGEENRYFIVDS